MLTSLRKLSSSKTLWTILAGLALIATWRALSLNGGQVGPYTQLLDFLGISGLLLIAVAVSFLTMGKLVTPIKNKRRYLAIALVLLIDITTANTLAGHVGGSVGNYDEQLGVTFSSDLVRLDVNVTTVEQAEGSNSGPAYLLNGLSNASYWYQVGIAWDWYGPRLACDLGFTAIFSVFAPNNTGVPVTGVISKTISARQGDRVLLSLYFSNGNVIMHVKDWDFGSTAEESYPAFGATYFRGLPRTPSFHGFFTGLMTEQYHDSYYYGPEHRVVYTWSTNLTKTSAIAWVGEYLAPNPTPQSSMFRTTFNYNFTQEFSFATYGAYMLSNQHEFATGQLPLDPPSARWVCAVQFVAAVAATPDSRVILL